MNLSDRDKKLLLVLLILVIVCVPYFFVIQPMLEKQETLEKEISTLRSEVSYQESLALRKAEYEQEAADYALAEEELIAQFPSELSQDASIMFINETEKKIPISLYQVTFGDDVAAQVTSEAEEEAIADVEEAMGETTQTQVIEDNTNTTGLGGGLTGISTQTRFVYDAGYEEFKDFLKYILDYHDRMVITELDAQFSSELDLLNGNFTLTQYALSGRDRYNVTYLEPSKLQGTTNIFKQATGNYSASSNKETTDFFILLNQPEADIDAVIVGQSNDVSEDTYLASDVNDVQEVTVTFTGEDGEYNANYSIGNDDYGEDGVDFVKDGTILLQIISSERLSSSDKVAVNLYIVNNTDTTVIVETINEDSDNPRVNIKGKTGQITVN